MTDTPDFTLAAPPTGRQPSYSTAGGKGGAVNPVAEAKRRTPATTSPPPTVAEPATKAPEPKPAPKARRNRAVAAPVETAAAEVLQVRIDPTLLAKLDAVVEAGSTTRGRVAMSAIALTHSKVRETLDVTAKSVDNPFAEALRPDHSRLRPLADGRQRVSVAFTVPGPLYIEFEKMREELGASRGVLLETALELWKP